MASVEKVRDQGNCLFRWRSYIPLVFIFMFGMAFNGFDWPLQSYVLHEVWSFICLGISIMGLAIRVITVGFAPTSASSRNARDHVPAQLNTSGIYSVVRHPLYLGSYFIGLGVALILLVWWLPVMYSLMFWMYYERSMSAREAILRDKFKEAYERWAALTPAFWPSFSHWRRPDLPFSFRNVLRREYTGLLVVVLGHSGTEVVEHLVMDNRVVWEIFWTTL
jgi:protein-S-isoprenylcysteine O-methyltransferase Ste14